MRCSCVWSPVTGDWKKRSAMDTRQTERSTVISAGVVESEIKKICSCLWSFWQPQAPSASLLCCTITAFICPRKPMPSEGNPVRRHLRKARKECDVVRRQLQSQQQCHSDNNTHTHTHRGRRIHSVSFSLRSAQTALERKVQHSEAWFFWLCTEEKAS